MKKIIKIIFTTMALITILNISLLIICLNKINANKYDVNSDSRVDVCDVIEIINYIKENGNEKV